jgi:hypothetical protein
LVVGEEAVVAVGGLVVLVVLLLAVAAAAAAAAAAEKGSIVGHASTEGFVELYMEGTGLSEDAPLVGNVAGLIVAVQVDESYRNPVRLAEVGMAGLLKPLVVA